MDQPKPHNWIATERVIPDQSTCAINGNIRVETFKTVWLFGHGIAGLIGIVLFPHVDALLVFLTLTAITICAGHSVGMHRLLIHRSFEAPKWVEYILVWLGVLVGMAGPYGMLRAHDMRDWHQRQTVCPPHPSHGAGFWRDAWWQLCCRYQLRHPPKFQLEARIADDPFYQLVERTWPAQQIPISIILFVFGGWAWVLWGVCLRVFVSLVGHWMIGHFAHRSGQQNWEIKDLPVQGYNLPAFALISFGESLHGNHHAFPYSAKLAVKRGERDPGYLFIRLLEKLGLAWDVKLPSSFPPRTGLVEVRAAELRLKEG